VVQAASRQIANTVQPAEGLLLAADVGGTYARVGLVRAGATPAVTQYHKYRCADHASLGAILKAFLEAAGVAGISHGAIACAGYVLDDAVINTNLPWKVSLAQIRADLNLADLLLVNDFTAIAYATRYVESNDVMTIAPAAAALDGGPVLVVGPGTGLGAAVRIPGSAPTILSTEAGQAALTASTPLEVEILTRLMRKASHVPMEQVLSGPGLANLYAVLADIRGATRRTLSPNEVTAAALSSADAVAREALGVFCGWLGSTVGNLVLTYGAQGGVFLAGGILPQMREFLQASDFVARFHDKGAMRPVLERVPVSLIEHGQLGVLGAAGWYLDRQRLAPTI